MIKKLTQKSLRILVVWVCFFSLQSSYAVRIKDVATVKGVRENILIGYGIVVGLRGTGDSSADVTSQSLGRLFNKLGLDTQGNAAIKSKNAAAVIVTAKLPPFARAGSKIDVTVSSIGDSASLEGGMLIVTPLRAGDQNVYAVAQGPVSVGALADGGGKTFPTVGRLVGGATVEKDIENVFAQKRAIRLSLSHPDFTTAARLSAKIDSELGGKYATARDGATIDVVVPFNYEGRIVEFMAALETLEFNVDQRARVVLNERTGTIVMGDKLSISPVALAHGDLSIAITNTAPGGGGAAGSKIFDIKGAANVSDLVKALNALGVGPKDLTAIFQALKANGALQAELEIL